MRRTLALLLALVMALSCFGLAFAEEEEIVSEAVEEVVAEAEFDLGGDEEEVPAEEEIADEIVDEALFAGEDDIHGVIVNGVLQFHCGEKIALRDVYEGNVPDTWVLWQEGGCGTGKSTIWRFECTKQENEPNATKTIHEIVIPPEHWWSSDADSWDNEWGKVTKEPTCTEAGEAIDYCLNCKKTRHEADPKQSDKIRVIEPLGHSWERGDGRQEANLVMKELPTCVKAGTAELQCTTCGAVLSTVKPTYDQMFDLIVNGKVGDKDEVEKIERNDKEEIVNVTMKVAGDKFYTTNKVYGEGALELKFTNYAQFKKEYIGYMGHQWDGWVIDKKATCFEEGSKIHWCKLCGQKDVRVIPALDPEYVLTDKIIIDCYHYANVYTCKNCKSDWYWDDDLGDDVCPHPTIYKVVMATSHEPDAEMKRLIDEWYDEHYKKTFMDWDYAERVLTNEMAKEMWGDWFDTDIPVLAVVPRCKYTTDAVTNHNKGIKIYPCAHEKAHDGEPEHDKVLADLKNMLTGVVDGKAKLEGITNEGLKQLIADYEAGDYIEKQHAADTKVYAVAADKDLVVEITSGEDKFHDLADGKTVSNLKSKGAMKTAVIAAQDHEWGPMELRYKIGQGDNQTAYYIHTCKKCGTTEEIISTTDPETGAPSTPAVVPPKPATIGDVIESGAAVEVKDTAAATVYYVRVSTTYVLANGTELNLITAQPVVNGKIQLDDIPGATVKNRFAILTTTSGSTKKAPADLVQLDTKSIK